jgi:transcriptional regulator with XRE-family HTH domain
MNVLKRIYQLRTERGWSEYQLAEAAELPQSTISSWYRKDMLPSIGSLEKICRGLGITMSRFFDESDESVSLTSEQRRLLNGWERLTPKQRESMLIFLESL